MSDCVFHQKSEVCIPKATLVQFVITVCHCCAVYSTSAGSLNKYLLMIIDPGTGRYVVTIGTSVGSYFSDEG